MRLSYSRWPLLLCCVCCTVCDTPAAHTTVNTTMSGKRVPVGAASPLDDAGILLHVLDILGPGHFFVHLSCEQGLAREL
jgi:hypothetical protein